MKWPCQLLLLILLIGAVACASKTKEQEVEEAIQAANNLLTERRCNEAISLLETLGRQNTNAFYLQTLASAYACRSGFDEPTLFGTDLDNILLVPVWGSFTLFESAPGMSTPSDSKFSDLFQAINILLFAGGLSPTTEPTSAERALFFNSTELGNMNAQILWLTIAGLGSYLRYYGNTDLGVKAAGGYGNSCFLNYDGTIGLDVAPGTLAAYLGVINGLGNNCPNDADLGHPQLRDSDAGDITIDFRDEATLLERLCQGVVLNNTFRTVLFELVAEIGGNEGQDLGDVQTTINAAEILTLAAKNDETMQSLLDTMSVTNCKTNFATATGGRYLQIYFAYMFEALLI